MQIGMPAETSAGETRTAASLETAPRRTVPRGPAQAARVANPAHAAPSNNAALQCPR